MNAIIVSLGNLHTSMLGCYGGTWLETPALDSLAASSFVFDQCYIECPSPENTRRMWWTGRLQQHHSPHPSTESVVATPSLINSLRASGVRTVLIRDTGSLVDRSQDTRDFEEVIEIARDNEDTTQIVFDAAKRWLSDYSNTNPFLLFVDSHGAHQPIRIEIDESESDGADDEQEDPFVVAVSYLDQQIGRFLEWLQQQPYWDQSLVGFTSDVGCAVESGLSNPGSPELSERRTHVPLIIRFPGTEHAGRSAALVQSIDLIPTVLDAMGLIPPNSVHGMSLLPVCRGERTTARTFVRLTIPGGARAIRTSDWYLVETHSLPEQGESTDRQLFAMPDDRWNRDDVAKRYPETVGELSSLLEKGLD